MSLRFVFGPAGSGKSTYVQEYIRKEADNNPNEDYLLIVPDQFTMQTQMDMVKSHPRKGILNIDVLSFGRLSYRVFSVTGKSDVPVLDDTGKNLVLRRVASLISEEMPFLGQNLNRTGYISEVKSQISEFMQYGLSVNDVKRLSEKVENGLLKRKIHDLATVYENFMQFNKDKYITSEETLDQLRDKLAEADFIKGSTVVFDGFTGFTPIQERVILRLCELAKEVIITFDISEPESPMDTKGEEKLFYLSRKGAMRLKTMALDLHIPVDEDVIIDSSRGRFLSNPEFMHLEKNLFRFPVKEYEGEVKKIRVFSCDSIDSEVNEIILRINDLVRSGEYAYRDIAVVTGNLESYGLMFENRMQELEMPVFIDRTSAIVLNPFTEYLKSALLILIKDYSYDSVFHYLRSGFTEFTDEEVDCFDRYVRSLNIRGKSKYVKEFTRFEKGFKDKQAAVLELERMNEIRKRFHNQMKVFENDGKTAGDYVKSLYLFLKANNSYEKLTEYQAFFEQENNLSKAREYAQIYKCIMDLLDQIVSLIGDEEMSLEEFYHIFEAGISEIEVGTIPKNVDRIVVGDIERTRLNEIKVLFFAGVNEGNIPKSTDKGGILTQAEREMIQKAGYDMAPTPREEMFTQRLYLYMNMCKPTVLLTVSYSNTDNSGKGMRPSYLIDVLKKLFPALEIEEVKNGFAIDKMVSMKDSFRFFAGLMREYVAGELDETSKVLAESLYKLYSTENIDLAESMKDASFRKYVAQELSAEIIKKIYGETIRGSVSKMELYAKCAYAFFLRYGMGLKPNEEYGFESYDLGNIYHGVLDRFSAELEKEGLTWQTFDPEKGKEMVRKAVLTYCEEYEQGLLQDDEENAYKIMKITKIMERTISVLQFQAKRGRFDSRSHEYSFTREIELDGKGRMELQGKIDRIDIYEQDDKVFVKIIDYKSSAKSIDITDVYHGISQQLAVYMLEAINREKQMKPEKDIIPSAMLYYSIADPVISLDKPVSDEEIEKAIQSSLHMRGMLESETENIENLDTEYTDKTKVLPIKSSSSGTSGCDGGMVVSREEFENMLSYVEKLMKNIGENILSGDKRISPIMSGTKGDKDSCEYCDYKNACRFDKMIKGYEKRNAQPVSTEEATEIVMGGDANGKHYTFS